ncbi:MAG: family 16 glycoside hydrolase [Candidatus Brocadiia bacterium]
MGAKMPRVIQKHQVPKVARKIVSASCAVFMLVVLSALLWGDEESARVYIKKAKEQVQKKAYEAALGNLQKAMTEAPKMPDVYFERGLVYLEAREMSEAMRDFDKAMSLLKDRSELTAKEKEFQRKIGTYQAEYGKFTDELAGIHQKYSTKFLELAKKYQDNGDEYLTGLFGRLGKISPGNDEIKQRAGDLNDVVAEQKKTLMTSLFNGENLDGWCTSAPCWTVGDGAIIGDLSKGCSTLKHSCSTQGNYMLSASIKIEDPKKTEYMSGLAVGCLDSTERFFGFGFLQDELVFLKYNPQTVDGNEGWKAEILEKKPPLTPVDTAQWNEISIKVDDDRIRCYLNKELCFDMKIDGEKGRKFKGSPGIIIDEGKAFFKDILFYAE